MKSHLRYLSYVLRHKWFVLLAGLELGVPLWQLITHDWSKFLPSEWLPYVQKFYGPKPPAMGATGYYHVPGLDLAFDTAWNRHQKRQPHHWQYWMLVRDTGEQLALPMPEHYAREMLADWRGAGMAQGKPDTQAWYETNRNKMVLHPETRQLVESLLGVTNTP